MFTIADSRWRADLRAVRPGLGAGSGHGRKRDALAPALLVFADHLVKHATPLGAVDVVQSAKDLRLRGLADAVIVSGAETGAAVDPQRLAILRSQFVTSRSGPLQS